MKDTFVQKMCVNHGFYFLQSEHPGKNDSDLQIVMFYLQDQSVAHLADIALGTVGPAHMKT